MVFIIIVGAFLNALSLNLFLIPAKVLSSGFTGISQLLSILFQHTPFPISTGTILFILNIPVAWIGWRQVGKRFTLYSIMSVVLTTVFLNFIPVKSITPDIMLNSVFGGVILAIGVGITLKYGASTGGLDIIAMILSRKKDKPMGIYFFGLNALIVLSAGFFFSWTKALYTLISLYATSKIIDVIHTRHVKLTAMIITNHGKEIQQAIQQKMVRGITKVPAKGAYSNQDKDILLIVLTRYELFTLEQIVKKVDPEAFTNIIETVSVFGQFRKT
ncbi:YitT family protein [Terrilactibacillus laevilacticus]|uniref:YitT family protein n=1 Tax=Terrilactibacillus laevilacticus TaxID=1380157 RepID=A0ABW5PQG0_9BACI|nr:YitT family protein [Terrilactibacillus laevilacticus]